MSRILDHIIASLDDITNLKISPQQIHAGAKIDMTTANSYVAFDLFDRRVRIAYRTNFPVTISDQNGEIITLGGGRDLLIEIIARGDRKSLAEVFPDRSDQQRKPAIEWRLLAGYMQICMENGIEPTSSDVLAAADRFDQQRGRAA